VGKFDIKTLHDLLEQLDKNKAAEEAVSQQRYRKEEEGAKARMAAKTRRAEELSKELLDAIAGAGYTTAPGFVRSFTMADAPYSSDDAGPCWMIDDWHAISGDGSYLQNEGSYAFADKRKIDISSPSGLSEEQFERQLDAIISAAENYLQKISEMEKN